MDINAKIKEIKQRIKDITSHFPYSDYEISLLTVCYIAIASIDNDIVDLLDEVLATTFILFNNGKFTELLRSLNENPNNSGDF
ncbi:MAG: hypothetical protein K2J20_02305 [Bacilli bacterium]|nr:hypothetical protein [Bacilli bacterium]